MEGDEADRERAGDSADIALGWRGVQRFGDLDTPRRRVLVIGDSFTAGRGAGREHDFATLLGRRLDVEIFSYGGEGYSTAQELLVARRCVRRIRPNLVILQMSTNDFINNSYELESRSFINNNLKMRPYFEAGSMVERYPPFGGRLRAALVDRSALARRLFYGADLARAGLAGAGFVETIEDDIEATQGRHDAFRRSVETTRVLLALLRDATQPVPLRVFPADGVGRYAFYRIALAELCSDVNVPFLDVVPEAVAQADSSAAPVFLKNDPHWSARGHAIVAEELEHWLRSAPDLAFGDAPLDRRSRDGVRWASRAQRSRSESRYACPRSDSS